MWMFCNVQVSGMEKILQARSSINRFLWCAKESTEIPDFVMLSSETCESNCLIIGSVAMVLLFGVNLKKSGGSWVEIC